jgi:hypothetical protein
MQNGNHKPYWSSFIMRCNRYFMTSFPNLKPSETLLIPDLKAESYQKEKIITYNLRSNS